MTLQLSNPMRQMLDAWGSNGFRRIDMARETTRSVGVRLMKDTSGKVVPMKDTSGSYVYLIKRPGKGATGPTWSPPTAKEIQVKTFQDYQAIAEAEFTKTGDPAAFFRRGGNKSMAYYPDTDAVQPGQPIQPKDFEEAVRPDDITRTQDAPSGRSAGSSTPLDDIRASVAEPGGFFGDGYFANPDGSFTDGARTVQPDTDEWRRVIRGSFTPGDIDEHTPKPIADEIMGRRAAPAPEPEAARAAQDAPPPRDPPRRGGSGEAFGDVAEDAGDLGGPTNIKETLESHSEYGFDERNPRSRASQMFGGSREFYPEAGGAGDMTGARRAASEARGEAGRLLHRGRGALLAGGAAVGGLGLGLAIEEIMKRRQGQDPRVNMADPDMNARYRAEAQRLYDERLGPPRQNIQQQVNELDEIIRQTPIENRGALTRQRRALFRQMNKSKVTWMNLPASMDHLSDEEIMQAFWDQAALDAEVNVDAEFAQPRTNPAQENQPRTRPSPDPTPDAGPTPAPDWTADKAPTPPSSAPETPSSIPDTPGSATDGPDAPRRRGRFRRPGAAGLAVAAATAGGLGLGYTLHDIMQKFNQPRQDMAPLPAVVAGNKFAEAHKAARNVFDRMIRQGQSEGEARVTASRWVKGNLNVDVEWPEAPGFDAGAVGASAWRHPNDAGFGRSQKWWDNFYRGMDDNPRSNAYRDRNNQWWDDFHQREQGRERNFNERQREWDRQRQQRRQADADQFAEWDRQSAATAAESDGRAEYAERMAEVLERNQSTGGMNPWIPSIGVPVGAAGLGAAGLAGGGYIAGRRSGDPKPSPEIEAMGWPVPQSYRAGRKGGDQSRFDQDRMDMAPVDLPEQWPYARVPYPDVDSPLPPADPAQVRAIQQQLLDEAGGNLTKARAAAQKLENQRLKDLEARVKPLRGRSTASSTPAYSPGYYSSGRNLTPTPGPTAVEYRPSISDPVHIATTPFLAGTGPQRDELDRLAAEYGVDPKKIAQDRERLQNPRASRPTGPRPRSGQPMDAVQIQRMVSEMGDEPPMMFDPDTLKDAWDKAGNGGDDISPQWQQLEISDRGDELRAARRETWFNNRVRGWENNVLVSRDARIPRAEYQVQYIQGQIEANEKLIVELDASPRGARGGVRAGINQANRELEHLREVLPGAIEDLEIQRQELTILETQDPRIERQVQRQAQARHRLIQEEVARQQGRAPEGRIEEPWQVEERGIRDAASPQPPTDTAQTQLRAQQLLNERADEEYATQRASALEAARQRGDIRVETVPSSTGSRFGQWPFHTKVMAGNQVMESQLFATQEEADAAMKEFQEKYRVATDAPEATRAPDPISEPEPEVRRNAPENVVDEPEPARYIEDEPSPRAGSEPDTPSGKMRRGLRIKRPRGSVIAGTAIGALGLGAVLATEIRRRRAEPAGQGA